MKGCLNIETRHIAVTLALNALICAGCFGLSWGYYDPASIEYKQCLTMVISEYQVGGWPTDDEQRKRYITNVDLSADGSRIAFRVVVDYFNHLYVCQTDVSDLQDLTDYFSETFRSWPIQLNDGGTRVFYGQGGDISHCNLSGPTECYHVDILRHLELRLPETIQHQHRRQYYLF